MAMFKKGDWVKSVEDGPTNGRPGVVVEVDDDGTFLVEFDEWRGGHGPKGNQWWLIESNFSLSETAKNPAIVAMLENGQPRPSARPHVHATTEAAHLEAARLATQHKGQEFAVYALDGNVHKVGTTYEHEWQRLAAEGQIHNATRALQSLSGVTFEEAKAATKRFAEHKRAA